MSGPGSQPIGLNATVPSNYASTAAVSWLGTTLDDLQTVPAVRSELEQGRAVANYAPVDSMTAALPDDFDG